MPLFEVDAERPVLVQPSPPGGALGTDAQRVVDGNIDGLLGEQIFPVASGTTPDDPHLLALDAAGLPVVIEVVGELTEASLGQALNHAGRAGRYTRADLAGQYSGGAGRFHQDVSTFYDNVPLTRSQATSRATGARLIIICSSAAPSVLDALDFLRQPGSPVAVLQLGVVHGADGRRFVDVSPLTVTRSTPAEPAGPEVASFAEGLAVGRALTGKLPVVTQHPRPAPAPETPVPDPPPAPRHPTRAPSSSLSRAERRRAQEDQSPTTYGAAGSTVETGPMLPIDIGTISVEPAPEPRQSPPPAPAPERAPSSTPDDGPVRRASILTRESVRTRESIRTRESYLSHGYDAAPQTAGDTGYDPLSYRPPGDLAVPDYSVPDYSVPDYSVPDLPTPSAGQQVVPAPPQAHDVPPLGPDDDPDLLALAGAIGAPTRLVWSRPRRGQRFEAVLYPDGFIELTDGARFRHPDAAAVAVSGTHTADGWSVWRLGDGGPSLTDAFRAHHA
ncbi:hypothetical protein [Oerskovia flava]|uniref:restriction system modified-DNA reader domain-containing protein n=1 Tax=Oerskovia flava TaxID=2986422 RepID=UPI00223FEA40|nr:hypothetical protein [Oerskovia sp. JB1-3-2]